MLWRTLISSPGDSLNLRTWRLTSGSASRSYITSRVGTIRKPVKVHLAPGPIQLEGESHPLIPPH